MSGQVATKRRDADQIGRALQPWLARQLPGRSLDALTVTAPSGHGFSNDTVMVDATVDGAAVPLVVQAAPTGPGLFPEYPIARMAAVQRDLRNHSDAPVANVRWFEADSSVLGAPFYVMDRIDGLVPDEVANLLSLQRLGFRCDRAAATADVAIVARVDGPVA